MRSTLLHARLSDKAIWEVERLGEPAFDFIAGNLSDCGLTERERINSLRLLGSLCKEVCVHRKADVVALATGLLRDPSPQVRSQAAHAGLHQARVLDRMPTLRAIQRPDWLDLKRAFGVALTATLELGLDEPQAQMARIYLASAGT